MTDEPLSEVDRLKAELESYRQREIADLRAALAAVREELAESRLAVEHYRTEAYKHEATAKAIFHEAERERAKLLLQLAAKGNVLAGQ